jgi:hypothetical protein
MRKRLGFFLAISVACASLCSAQQVSLRHSSNLRQNPSTSSDIIETLQSGDTVMLTATQTQGGYYPARTGDGKVGWIWAKNVVLGNAPMSVQQLTVPAARVSNRFTQSCSNPTYPSAATPIDSACGAAGTGGKEASQNEAKNYFCAADPARPMTIQDLTDLQKQVEADKSIPFGKGSHPLSDQPGPATDRTHLVSLGEGSQVVVVAYVKKSRGESPETVNCSMNVPNTAVYHDIHISLVADPNDDECGGIVAEMIPHHRPATWTPNLVNKLAAAKVQVRVTGDLMFDSSHTPCVVGAAIPGDPARVSLWEVHPIYKFEVCTKQDCSSGRGWVLLDAWKPE